MFICRISVSVVSFPNSLPIVVVVFVAFFWCEVYWVVMLVPLLSFVFINLLMLCIPTTLFSFILFIYCLYFSEALFTDHVLSSVTFFVLYKSALVSVVYVKIASVLYIFILLSMVIYLFFHTVP